MSGRTDGPGRGAGGAGPEREDGGRDHENDRPEREDGGRDHEGDGPGRKADGPGRKAGSPGSRGGAGREDASPGSEGDAPAPGSGRTHTLGLLYPPAGRGRHYTGMQLDFIGGVAEAATEYGYDLLLSPSGSENEPSFQRILAERRVDGLIVMEIRRDDDRVEHLAKAGFPFVTIGRNRRAEETGWVDLDFAGLSASCVQHLADLGHSRIAFVNRSQQLFESGYGFAHLALEGYTEATARLGFTPHAYLCDDDTAGGEATTRGPPRSSP